MMSEPTAVTVESVVPAGVALLEEVAPEEAVLDQTVEELLVEEVSIDGMCGVY
jgi:mycofactocin precursor